MTHGSAKLEAAPLKILLVEDNAEMRAMTKFYLENLAADICECEDGFDALACYEEFMPDWVLMDWEMKRMDGLEATRRIIYKFPEAKVLIVTQYDDRELRRAAAQAGARGYMLKENLQSLRLYLSDELRI